MLLLKQPPELLKEKRTMTKCLPLLLAGICALNNSFAQTSINDKNVTISSQKENIEFVKSDKNNGASVRRTQETEYLCSDYRTSITVADMYNDQETIDDIDIYVNGDKAKNIVPQSEYYSVSGIFYSDARVTYFRLPLEKKGSTSRVKISKTIKDPRYLTQVYFTQDYFTTQKQIIITIPSWMQAEIKEYNFQGNSIQKTVDKGDPSKTVYTYTARNLQPRKDENACPGPTYVYPHLLILSHSANINGEVVKYFSSTAEQYKWYHSLVKQVANDPAEIKAKADEITKGIPDDIEKIKAIYYWVQDNIRYVAFENGIAGFKPMPAQQVLAKKYGDCKGMANLITELLRSQGFDARLCWIGTSHIAYDYSTPSLAVDNHMISALIYKGKKYFLDATETNIGFNQYAERIQGRQVLIENGDQFILDHVPTTVYTQNTEKEVRHLQIDGTSLKGTAEHSYSGESKEGILTGIQSVKKDQLDAALKEYLSENTKDYQLNNITIQNAVQDEKPLELKYNVVQANAVNSFGKEIYLDLDFRKEVGTLKIDTTKRTQDYILPYKMHLVTETSLDLPSGYSLSSTPQPFMFKHPAFEMKLSYSQQNGKLVYQKEISFKQVWIRKADFGKWNEAIEGLNNFYNTQVILTK